MQIIVQKQEFDPGQILSDFQSQLGDDTGAVVSFSGLVRADDPGFTTLEIEHYPGMTEKALHKIATDAKSRFDLADLLILHRFGAMQRGEAIMMVATAAAHRKAAFQGADYLMDFLKSRAPFWKREHGATGAKWVDARESDEDALNNWINTD